jgi:ABC-2 type transport system permease protein
MRRRIDLALALVHRPRLLFLDEPTTGLDPAARRSVWEEIEQLRASGVTILLTTQYLDEADRLCDRVAVIDRGSIAAEGTPEELKRSLGGDVIEIELPGATEAARAAALLGDGASAEGTQVRLTARDASSHSRGGGGAAAARARAGGALAGTADARRRLPRAHRAAPRTLHAKRGRGSRRGGPVTTAVGVPPAEATAGVQVGLLVTRILLMSVRDPVVWLPNLIFNVLLLLTWNGIFGDAHSVTQIVGGNYLNFLFPAIVLMAALAGGHAGFALVTDIEAGFFRRRLAMPLSRVAIVLGPMLAGAVQVVFQSTIIIALALAMGASPATGVAGLLALLALALLWGIAYAGFSAAVALTAGNAQAIQSGTILVFMLVFLTPLLLPEDQLQGWMQTVADANPLTYLIDAMRSLTVDGWHAGTLAKGFAVAGTLAAVMLAWAVKAARRATSPS